MSLARWLTREPVSCPVRLPAPTVPLGRFTGNLAQVTAAVPTCRGRVGANTPQDERLAGIRNPRREVSAEDCPGGQLAGYPEEAARQSPCDWHQPPPPRLSAPRPVESGSA